MSDTDTENGMAVLHLDDERPGWFGDDEEWRDATVDGVDDAGTALDRLDGAEYDVLVLEPAALEEPGRFLSAVEGAAPDLTVALYTRLDAGELDGDLVSAVATVVERGDGAAGFLREKLRGHEDGGGPEVLKSYETLVDAARDGIYVVDADGRYRYVNQSMADLVGYDRRDLEGRHASVVMEPGELDRGQAVIREMLAAGERESEVFDMTLRTAEGGRVVVGINFTLLFDDGTYAGLVGVARDVTERRRRERELQRQNERLDEFASLVSHDLRNPVEMARGGLELARTECDSEHLDRVESAVARMETIIDDTLTLARQGQTVGDIRPVDLATLARRCWETAGAGDATLRVEDPPTVAADPDRLEHVFENLFRNAVEHGGDDVTVTVGALDGDGFYVADDGPGIPDGRREEVFDVGTTTAEDGTGFGLTIVRRIVEAHGWRVRVTESEDGGARFEVTGVEAPAGVR